MRRVRDIKEHRRAVRRKTAEERRDKRQKQVAVRVRNARQARREKQADRLRRDHSVVAMGPISIKFASFDDYKVTSRKINVAHIIESLGMGGGQTMMMELVRALDKYYGDSIVNHVICPRQSHQKFNETFYSSYGISPLNVRERDLPRFMSKHDIHVALQHRLAVSKCLKPHLLGGTKYILMNHTYHQLNRLTHFMKCDYYVSVCDYLHQESRFSSVIHPSRRSVILNGVENDYLEGVATADLKGTFKTGRCHRLVQSKFHLDSLSWLDKKTPKSIPGHQHYIIGHHGQAKKLCKELKHCNYFGSVAKRNKKMGIIKALDVYFYETFQQEGASIAVLESLACGVPVLCKRYGGNPELITDGVNGYILKDRNEFLKKLKELHSNPKALEELKRTTAEDFENRLHVRHTACKYMQLFEQLTGKLNLTY